MDPAIAMFLVSIVYVTSLRKDLFNWMKCTYPAWMKGMDATYDFEDIGHSDGARELMAQFVIGDIDVTTLPVRRDVRITPVASRSSSETLITALQFLIPLTILALALAVRFLSNDPKSAPSSWNLWPSRADTRQGVLSYYLYETAPWQISRIGRRALQDSNIIPCGNLESGHKLLSGESTVESTAAFDRSRSSF
jgi:hypothetical protein